MFRFDQAILTSSGGRTENQDYAECGDLSGHDLVCVLADGLGGHRGGRVASRLAVATVFRTIRQDFRFSAEGLTALQQKAHQAIVAEQQRPGLEGMRSTLVVLVIRGTQALWLHCGDSRLYHFRDGRIIARTSDHSVPGLFVAANEISVDDIRRHPDRNKLLRSLGGSTQETRGTALKQPVTLEKEDRFLLSSDGFWEHVLEREMLDSWGGDVRGWLRSMEALIVQRAKAGHDNYTACAIRVT